MTDEQKKALEALRDVTCKQDSRGCNGPWCHARKLVLVAFSGEPGPAEAETAV